MVGDLHWLVHQGHVIEFANGILETAKKPLPRPARPQQPKKEAQASPTTESSAEAVPDGTEDSSDAAPAEQSAEVAQAEAIATETAPVQDESGVSAGADVTGTNQAEQAQSEENKDQPNPGA